MRNGIILSLVTLFTLVVTPLALASGKKGHTHYKIGGETVSVNATARTITVKGKDKSGAIKEFNFSLAEKARIVVNGKEGTLDEIKAGDPVTVHYLKKKDTRIAREIIVGMPANKSQQPAEIRW